MNNAHKARHLADKHGDQELGILNDAKERFSDLTDEARARGEKFIEQAKDRGNELLDDAQDQGKDAWKSIRTLIRKNPGKAVGYAFAAGAVFYALFVRRGDNR